MKTICLSLGFATALFAFSSFAAAPTESAGAVDFGQFTPSSQGGEFVEVNIGNNLISMVALLAAKAEPELADLLRGIQSVRVNVIGLKDDNSAAVKERMAAIRASLAGKGWERIVTAQKEGEDVAIYLKTRGQEAVEGLVVTVLQADKEAVFVNVIGDIRPEKLAELGEKLHIEQLKQAGKAVEKS